MMVCVTKNNAEIDFFLTAWKLNDHKRLLWETGRLTKSAVYRPA